MAEEFICRFCGKICKNANSLRNHERLCKQNPNRQFTLFSTKNPNVENPWNKGLTKATDERVAKNGFALSKAKKGCKGHPHTEEEKAHLRELALQRGAGGFFMRRGIDYNGIKLDSTYEVEVAKSLDLNNIKWVRCKRFPYVIEGKLHYYTPDFYLPDYDIYLDPKNDFLLNNINPRLGYTDLYKIEQVMIQNNIKVLVLSKDQLTWEYIKTKLDCPCS